jgi:hypothetical protein
MTALTYITHVTSSRYMNSEAEFVNNKNSKKWRN